MTRKSETKLILHQEKHDEILNEYLKVLKKLKLEFEVIEDENYLDLVNFKKNKFNKIHKWFDYKQGYSSELVKKIINEEKPDKNYTLLDPFCGVGTTNVAAQKMGYKSIGFDINPVATLASRVKCTKYDKEEIKLILNKLNNFKDTATISKNIPESPLLRRSFDQDTFNKLMKIKGFYENITEKKISDFFKLAYLSMIEDCSNRVKDGNGIKIVKNKNRILDVSSYFDEIVKSMINDINPEQKVPECKIIHGSILEDACFNLVKDRNIGIVIFSPPYANCFDYCEVYKLEIWMGGFVETNKDFWKYRSIAMRSHVNSKFDHNVIFDNNSVETIAELISCFNIWNKNIPDMIRGYFDDIQKLFIRLKKIMIPNSKCYIVVANSGYKGVLVPTDLLISEIAQKLGFNVKKIIHARKIRSSSQQMEELHGEYENLMRESVIVIENENS